jgi:hypothetical protein
MLALDAHQKGDLDGSREYLTELMGNTGGGAILDQAINLYEYLGFYGDGKSK